MKNKLLYMFLVATTFVCNGCDGFLDTTPDNRTEADTPDKIAMLLVKAYPRKLPIAMPEYLSDNVDKRHTGPTMDKYNVQMEEIALWKTVTETGSDSPTDIWKEGYLAIAHANQALMSIDELGNTDELKPHRGEALLCRAYAHFNLVNIFGRHINAETSATDLGVVYMEKAETEVNPPYERQTVKDNYDKIRKDLEEGLPLIDDELYKQPKFHFNKKAAYAFATRFYLYTGEWDKVIQCANVVLGENPRALMRDMSGYTVPAPVNQVGTVPNTIEDISKFYAKSVHKANLMVSAVTTRSPYFFGNYQSGKWYCISPYLAETEIMNSSGPWGVWDNATFYFSSKGNTQTSTSNAPYKVLAKYPYYYANTVINTQAVLFTSEEVLLSRAEAYIMKENYAAALEDLALWMRSWCTTNTQLSEALIDQYYGNHIPYWTPTAPTLRKKLGINLVSERQEAYMHCCLHFRRISTVHDGLRWYDLKRLKMDVVRRNIDTNNQITVLDKLKPNDLRTAVQIPGSVIAAGLQRNPR